MEEVKKEDQNFGEAIFLKADGTYRVGPHRGVGSPPPSELAPRRERPLPAGEAMETIPHPPPVANTDDADPAQEFVFPSDAPLVDLQQATKAISLLSPGSNTDEADSPQEFTPHISHSTPNLNHATETTPLLPPNSTTEDKQQKNSTSALICGCPCS